MESISSFVVWKKTVSFFFFFAPHQPGWVTVFSGSSYSLVVVWKECKRFWRSFFSPFRSLWSTLHYVRRFQLYRECWLFCFCFDKLPHWRSTAYVIFSFLCWLLHNLTNKMNVGVWALTFRSEKQHVCFFCFWMFVLPIWKKKEKKDVFSTLWRVLKVNTFRSGFHFFHLCFLYDVNVHSAG